MDKTDIPGTFNAGATLGPVNETNMARIWNKHKQTNTPLKRKVFVGLSGGVDSAVSAALLKSQGYDVTGVFIKVWQPEFYECTWKEDRLDAMRVCAKLEIPFATLDLEREYKRDVVDYMLAEYAAGHTPNPDVMCNKHIKFGVFLSWALERGADYIATGHYARVRKLSVARYELCVAKDREKDQTYFLWTLTGQQLARTLFPVGTMTKLEVRKLAKKLALSVAEKKDSQGLCFIGKVDMKEFLFHFIKKRQGAVLNEKGEIVGKHEGAYFFTLGERHGFTITRGGVCNRPSYVVAKNVEQNTITIAPRPTRRNAVGTPGQSLLFRRESWISGTAASNSSKLYARTRYRESLQKVAVAEAFSGTFVASFEKPQPYASPGQSIVFYEDGVCLGGGILA